MCVVLHQEMKTRAWEWGYMGKLWDVRCGSTRHLRAQSTAAQRQAARQHPQQSSMLCLSSHPYRLWALRSAKTGSSISSARCSSSIILDTASAPASFSTARRRASSWRPPMLNPSMRSLVASSLLGQHHLTCHVHSSPSSRPLCVGLPCELDTKAVLCCYCSSCATSMLLLLLQVLHDEAGSTGDAAPCCYGILYCL